MALHSVFPTPPPGSYAFDQNPGGIVTGQGFTRSGTALDGSVVSGARVWTPTGPPAQATFKLYRNPATDAAIITGTPLATKTVATTAGGWTTATFDTTHTFASLDVFVVTVTFTGTAPTGSAGDYYVAGTGTRATSDPVASPTAPSLVWSESMIDVRSGYAAFWYAPGASAVTVAPDQNNSYGIDIVVDDTGAGGSAALPTPVVTVSAQTNPTTAGNDGAITITWPAVSGAASYEAGIRSGLNQTTGFTTTPNATSPHTFTGLAAGDYTVAVRAIPPAV